MRPKLQNAKRRLRDVRFNEKALLTSRGVTPESRGRPLLVGLFSVPSGLGHGAHLLFKKMHNAGLNPAALDVTSLFYPGNPVLSAPDGAADDGRGPVILHVNPSEMRAVLSQFRIKNISQRKRIGVWAWEQETLPPIWQERSEWVHEVWASSQFMKQVFDQQLPLETHYVPYPCALWNPEAKTYFDVRQRQSASLRFLCSFDALSSIHRKNPEAAFQAFDSAKIAGSTLTVHARNLSETHWEPWMDDPRVSLVTDDISQTEYIDFLCQHDAVIHLHRAEGFGLLIAMAQVFGIPTIFTNYSGPSDFAACPNSYPISFERVSPPQEDYHYSDRFGLWAAPNVSEAVTKLQELSAVPDSDRHAQAKAAVKWWQDRSGRSIPI